MIFTQRIPSTKELSDYYSSYGASHYKSELTTKRYHSLLDSWEGLRKTNQILDIGCGVGFFLEVAKERGWKVFGSEYDAKLVAICQGKGIEMHQGSIETFKTDQKFDIVTSFEVIEHINSPQKEMRKINELIASGGHFYCTTPNFNSILRYYLKGTYNVISYPEHLSYFTPKTLHFLLKKSGFERDYLKTSGISLTRLKTSLGKSNEMMVSSQSSDEIVRNRIEKNSFLLYVKTLVNGLLNLLGLGMSLKALYRKA